MEEKALLVMVSAPSVEEGERIADLLVADGLAACVHVLPSLRAVYRWQGKVCHEDEVLLLIKTISPRYAELERRVLETHPYEVPEVLALSIEGGASSYLDWLRAQVAD